MTAETNATRITPEALAALVAAEAIVESADDTPGKDGGA